MTLQQATRLLDDHQYPTNTERLVADHGDHELDLPNGSETLGDVFERVGQETYDSPREAREALYCALSSKAVGRRHYSDRDPTTLGTAGPGQVSF